MNSPNDRPAGSKICVTPLRTFVRLISITHTQSTPSRCGPSGVPGVGAERARGNSPFDNGRLYVAKFHDDGTGEWVPLVPGSVPGYASLAEIRAVLEALLKAMV